MHCHKLNSSFFRPEFSFLYLICDNAWFVLSLSQSAQTIKEKVKLVAPMSIYPTCNLSKTLSKPPIKAYYSISFQSYKETIKGLGERFLRRTDIFLLYMLFGFVYNSNSQPSVMSSTLISNGMLSLIGSSNGISS